MSLTRTPVVVFAYDFPHRKTQDILLRLFLEGIPVKAVLAAPRVELGISSGSVRSKVRGHLPLHPRLLAERIGAEYRVLPHGSPEAVAYLRNLGVDLGVIGGARILGPDVIAALPLGIVNLHPGLLPEVRGLDALFWAVVGGHPLGVTAHLIDQRVDAGDLLVRRAIKLAADDTVFDLSERLYAAQLDVLAEAIDVAIAGTGEAVGTDLESYNRKMTPDQEQAALDALAPYLNRFASKCS